VLNLLRAAASGLRARRGRALLAALGIAAAALVVGTAGTVGYGLATGFDRAAERADLPHVIARFERESLATLDERVRALPNLAAYSFRTEVNSVPLAGPAGRRTQQGAVHLLEAGRRRGYAVVEGRDLSPAFGEVVVEQGLAREWQLEPGDRLTLWDELSVRVVGIAVSPDNVAYPLARAARVYLDRAALCRQFRCRASRPNLALLWLNDPERADVTLAQARTVSFGLGDLAFITREGVEVLLDQAAGIVLALLVAFSVVALVAAGTMLAAGAHAEVQRRLPAFGVQRALGFTPGRLAAQQAVEALLVAVPAALLGLAAGALAVAGPAGDLLAALNELPPGTALLAPLGLCLLGILAVVTAAATWPAWRAARRPPASILRGGDVPGGTRRARAGADTAGRSLVALGARFALAARARWTAAVATVGVCAGVVLLMLALASLLERLRDDPGTVGKRYSVTARLDPSLIPEVRAIPGVEAVGERYVADAGDAFRLGEPLRLVAYPGDHTRFEAPPLAEGRRVRGPREVEVGVGLADALGLRPGSPLAVQTASGAEIRLEVVGVVRALEREGRIAWMRPDRLLDAEPGLSPELAIRLTPGADPAPVNAALRELGAPAQRVGGATTNNGRFLGILATVLRGVGLAVGLVCLYALVQALAMTARERRGAVALLRALGGDRRTVLLVLAGAAAAVALPAALLGILLERLLFGPLVARLAAGYADLPLAPSLGQAALVALGLAALAALATALVARRALREPVVAGLRED